MKRRFAATACLLLCAWFGGCWARAPLHREAKRLNRQGAELMAQGHLGQAKAHFNLSLEYNPCHAAALHNLALLAFLHRDFAESKALETRALECQPLVQAVNGLGAIDLSRGLPDQALEHFRRALALDPGYVDARRNLVICLLRLGRTREAGRQLERLKALAPDDPWGAQLQRRLLTLRGVGS